MKLLILFFPILVLSSTSYSQENVYFTPKVKGDTLTYKTDTPKTTYEKIAVKSYYSVNLIRWRNGIWEANLHENNRTTHIYISDALFVEDEPMYREFLGTFSPKAKAINNLYLSRLIKKHGHDKGIDYYFHQPCIGMNSTWLMKCLGSPEQINSTITKGGSYDQWVYTGWDSTKNYYYLKNGIVVAIQK